MDFLYALVEHLDIPQVYLLGHSHGGFVAQRFALRYPDRVAGLALYSTSPMTGPEFSAAVQKAILAYPQRHPDVPDTAEVVAALAQDDTGMSADEKSVLLRQALPIYFADFWGRVGPSSRNCAAVSTRGPSISPRGSSTTATRCPRSRHRP